MKIVINTCFGGYSLSKKAYEFLDLEWDGYGYKYEDDRANKELVKCVEELGEEANGRCARLRVVEISDNIDWYIDEYDGQEKINEEHNSWY